VELLVVIAIIGVLVALLLPAVQAAREAARRAHCTNNVKQIGLAMHNFHSARNHFPRGYYWESAPGDDTDFNRNENEATWVYYLLPYLEETSVSDRTDKTRGFGFAVVDGTNETVIGKTLATFVCPSGEQAEPWNKAYAKGSYVANNGIGPMRDSTTSDIPVERPVPRTSLMSTSTAGVFFLNSDMKAGKITDGTSHTAFVSEIRMVAETEQITRVWAKEDFRGALHYPEGPLYHHNYTPNSLVPDGVRTGQCVDLPAAPCVEAYTNWRPRELMLTARSYHVGGVNLLLGDGGVRFVDDSIDLISWQALCTPQQVPGEPLGSDY
jgi:type II secretory pathway pseudopilin PulG